MPRSWVLCFQLPLLLGFCCNIDGTSYQSSYYQTDVRRCWFDKNSQRVLAILSCKGFGKKIRSKIIWIFVIFRDIKLLRVSKAFQIMQMVWNRGFFSIVACQRDWAEAPPNNLYICQIMRFREMLDFPDFINWELDTPFHLLGTTTWSKTSKNATKMQLFSETSWSRFISNLLECLGLWCWLSGSR